MASVKNRVQLDTLYDGGNLTVSLPLGDTETVNSNGFGALFDSTTSSDPNASTYLEISTPGALGTPPGYAQVRIDFSTPLHSGDYSLFIICDDVASSDGISLGAYDENDTALYNSGEVDLEPFSVFQSSTHNFTVPPGKTLSYFSFFIKMTASPARLYDFRLTFLPPAKRTYDNSIINSITTTQQNISDSSVSIIQDGGEFLFATSLPTDVKGKAVDNNLQTQFISRTDQGPGRYGLEFDLEAETGEAQRVDYIKVKTGNIAWGSWRVDYSLDGVTFITGEDRTLIQYQLHDIPLDHSLPIKKLRFSRVDSFGNSSFYVRIFEFQVYTYGNPEPVDFDFNDTVLTTKGWNSSRYDGKQLSAAKINEFTEGDSTYGKTPVVERYTRNIYIGNAVVGLNEVSNPNPGLYGGVASEDPSLLPIDNFSYIQSNHYITVNEDGSITHNRLKETQTDTTSKIGFYQSFYDDFPIGNSCRLIIFDPSVKNNLKPSYPIYFNGGQLQQIFSYGRIPDFPLGFLDPLYRIFHLKDASNSTAYPNSVVTIGPSVIFGADPRIYSQTQLLNKNLLRTFYPEGVAKLTGTENASSIFLADPLEHIKIYEEVFNYKNSSSYINDKRFFLTYSKGEYSHSPIRTLQSGSIPTSSNAALRTSDLAEISTIEIISASVSSSTITANFGAGVQTKTHHDIKLHISNKTKFNQDYLTQSGSAAGPYNSFSTKPTPPLAYESRVVISQLTDSVPSLLVNLDKSTEVGSNIGDIPFAIIPENLHPYVEDNLNFFLSKAGVNVSGDATQTIDEITANKRKQGLTPAQRRALARRQALSRQNWFGEETEKERRQRERRERRKNRKESRQENREERRENRQEKREQRRENRQEKKENRRENRQDRRENRKDRRQNRKNRRKNK